MTTEKTNLGTIQRGEKKHFVVRAPVGVPTGDVVSMTLEYDCGGCGRRHSQVYAMIVGTTRNIEYASCDCGLIDRLKYALHRLFGFSRA